MNLDRKELIAGHPIKKVRDFLKNHLEYEIGVSCAQQLGAEHFGGDSEAVLAELNKRGWLERGKRTWTPAVGPATGDVMMNVNLSMGKAREKDESALLAQASPVLPLQTFGSNDHFL